MISCIRGHNNYEEEVLKLQENLEFKITKVTQSLITMNHQDMGNIFTSLRSCE